MSQKRIFVLCPDRPKPTGGMKTIYRQAEILCDAGYDASVVHGRRGFRAGWFGNRSPVVAAEDVNPGPDDIVVVPEVFSQAFGDEPPARSMRSRLRFRQAPPEMPWQTIHDLIGRSGHLVILSLNPYGTFRGSSLDSLYSPNPYADPRLLAVLTISKDAEAYLQYAFPKVRVVNFTKAVDPSVFSEATTEKVRQVCFMPRKNQNDAIQILNLLRSRGALEGFETVPIDGLPEAEVAEVMRRSLVFLSLSHAEGLPRPPMEAMLSECLVVGYHGRGGREYILSPHAFGFEEGDVLGVARAMEEILARLRKDPSAYDEARSAGREFVLSHYDQKIEVAEVLAFWKPILTA